MQEIIDEYNIELRNGFYRTQFIEIQCITEDFGFGFGGVFKVWKNYDKYYAVKKIMFTEGRGSQQSIIDELKVSQLIIDCREKTIVQYFDVWLENDFFDHQNINELYNENLFEWTLYIQMELCEMSLRQMIKEMKHDLNFYSNNNFTILGYYIASEIFIELLEGVNYLHKHNIIHRDLKPDNILISSYGISGRFVRIADFGISIVHQFDGQEHEPERGTMKYMAPEVFDSNYDIKVDIYSLGITLRELFDIHYGYYENVNENQTSLLISKYKKMRELCDEVTRKDPYERPNCGKVLEDKRLRALAMNKRQFREQIRIFGNHERNHLSSVLKMIQFKKELEYPDLKRLPLSFLDCFVVSERYLSQFKDECVLGKGSYAQVFKVTKRQNQNEVFAIRKFTLTSDTREEFLKELSSALIITRLKHENLVQYYDVWLENITQQTDPINNLTLCIQMELCDTNLTQIIKYINEDSNLRGSDTLTPLGYYLVIEIFIRILEGLNYLHKHYKQIIHRDLRPDNILLKIEENSNSFIKIADFGLVSIHQLEDETQMFNTKSDIHSVGEILLDFFDIDKEIAMEKIIEMEIKNKMPEYHNIIELMNEEEPNDCHQIIRYRHQLDLNEFSAQKEFEKVSESFNNENSDIFKLLKKAIQMESIRNNNN